MADGGDFYDQMIAAVTNAASNTAARAAFVAHLIDANVKSAAYAGSKLSLPGGSIRDQLEHIADNAGGGGSPTILLPSNFIVLNDGTLTSDTPVTLDEDYLGNPTGLQTGDLVALQMYGQNNNTTPRTCTCKEGGQGIGFLPNVCAASGYSRGLSDTVFHLIGASINASLYYAWSGTVSGGLDLYIKRVWRFT